MEAANLKDVDAAGARMAYVSGTYLYRPEALRALLQNWASPRGSSPPIRPRS